MWTAPPARRWTRRKIEALLAQVSGLRAASFETAAHASLKSPVLTVKAMFDKG